MPVARLPRRSRRRSRDNRALVEEMSDPAITNIEQLKIYGERNTGTNFLKELCRKNFAKPVLSQSYSNCDEEIDQLLNDYPGDKRLMRTIITNRLYDLESQRRMSELLGWKHMRPPVDFLKSEPELAARTLFIVIVKHPVFWALSFHKRPYHDYFYANTRRMEFSDFIRHMFIPTGRDNVEALYYTSIVDLYADKVDGYRELAELGVSFELVRYEDLLLDAPGFVDRIARRYGIRLRKPEIYIPDESTKRDERQLSDFQAQYDVENVRSFVSPEDFAFILSRFGRDRLSWLGYPAD